MLDEEEEKNAIDKKKKSKKVPARELSLMEKTYEQLGWGDFIAEVCIPHHITIMHFTVCELSLIFYLYALLFTSSVFDYHQLGSLSSTMVFINISKTYERMLSGSACTA